MQDLQNQIQGQNNFVKTSYRVKNPQTEKLSNEYIEVLPYQLPIVMNLIQKHIEEAEKIEDFYNKNALSIAIRKISKLEGKKYDSEFAYIFYYIQYESDNNWAVNYVNDYINDCVNKLKNNELSNDDRKDLHIQLGYIFSLMQNNKKWKKQYDNFNVILNNKIQNIINIYNSNKDRLWKTIIMDDHEVIYYVDYDSDDEDY